jgi:hypothetical protein
VPTRAFLDANQLCGGAGRAARWRTRDEPLFRPLGGQRTALQSVKKCLPTSGGARISDTKILIGNNFQHPDFAIPGI